MDGQAGLQCGFIGTGTITAAVVRAVCTVPNTKAQITVSPRNRQTAERLAAEFARVRVAQSNQAVVDASDCVCIALRRQIVQQELQALRFRAGQTIVSFVPTIARAQIAAWCRCSIDSVYRAVPLPFIAAHHSVTPVFPANALLQDLFSQTGGAAVAQSEAQFDAYMLGGSMMGVYFRFARACAGWLAAQGLDAAQASTYVAQLFANLAHEAHGRQAGGQVPDFHALQREYSTPGGTNEIVAQGFEALGGVAALAQALDAALKTAPISHNSSNNQ